jgi:hypothetical protein
VLGHFCTGVTVITGPGPAGFACLTWVQCAIQAVHEAGD